MLGTMLSTLQELSHFVLTIILRDWCHYFSYFTMRKLRLRETERVPVLILPFTDV